MSLIFYVIHKKFKRLYWDIMKMIKKVFDLFFSMILLIILIPLFVVVGILIKGGNFNKVGFSGACFF